MGRAARPSAKGVHARRQKSERHWLRPQLQAHQAQRSLDGSERTRAGRPAPQRQGRHERGSRARRNPAHARTTRAQRGGRGGALRTDDQGELRARRKLGSRHKHRQAPPLRRIEVVLLAWRRRRLSERLESATLKPTHLAARSHPYSRTDQPHARRVGALPLDGAEQVSASGGEDRLAHLEWELGLARRAASDEACQLQCGVQIRRVHLRPLPPGALAQLAERNTVVAVPPGLSDQSVTRPVLEANRHESDVDASGVNGVGADTPELTRGRAKPALEHFEGSIACTVRRGRLAVPS